MFVSVMEVKAGLPWELLYNDYLVLVAKSEEAQKDSKVKTEKSVWILTT